MLFDRFRVKTTAYFIFFISFFLISQDLFGIQTQGIPPIINYDSKDYKGSNKIFQIIQDSNYVLYASTVNSILVYDGSRWKSLAVNGVPAFEEKRGVIYVGLYNNFGKIVFTLDKGYFFESLLDDVYNIGQVENVCAINESIYLSTSKDLYLFYNNKLTLLETFDSPVSLFRSGNKVYLFVQKEGLFQVTENRIKEASGGKFFTNKEIINILNFGKVEYIVTRQNGIYYYDSNLFYVLPESKNLLLQKDICCAETLNNQIVIGTHKNGLFVLDSKGHLISSYPFESGLYSSEINHIFIDQNDDFWLSTDYGISFLENSASVTFFNEYNGLLGVVNDVRSFEDKQYIATTQGLFTYSMNSKQLFQSADIQSVVYNVFVFNNELYCSTERGVFKNENGRWKLFYNSTWLLAQQSAVEKDVLLVANQNGFFIYKTFNKQLYRLFSLSSITKDINSISEDKNNIWVGTNYNGVYRIEYKQTFDSITDIQQYRDLDNFNVQWVKAAYILNKTVFLTRNGIYSYIPERNAFISDSTIAKNLIGNYTIIDPIAEIQSNIFFAARNENSNITRIGHIKSDSLRNRLAFNFLRSLSNNNVQKLIPQADDLWVITEKELIYFSNTNYVQEVKSKTFFTQIVFQEDSILQLNPAFTNALIVPKGIRNIEIEAVSSSESRNQEVLYQFKIDGYDKQWLEWQQENYFHIENLPRGKYNILVRSKDINGNVSKIAGLELIVQAPFYISIVAYILYFLIVLSGFFVIIKWRAYNFALERFKLEETINKRTKELILQREKTEELLKSYAPKETIEKLHDFRKEKAQRYKMVTILFADIIGFNTIAKQESSTEIIDELDKFYYQFDQVVERLNIKKIKTVGDTYMAAGGIPKKNRTNPIEVVLAAFEMQQYLEHLNKSHRFKEIKLWDIRFGIHTGPVFAEENPWKKHPYDIWGETVNIASRMQSSGEIGKVNISGNTYELIREYFICQYRGKMPVKYRGDIDMYFIEGFRPKLSIDEKGILPNDAFKTKLALIRYDDLEELILNKMERELPPKMHYHNLKHTIDVIVQVELIGRSEGISDDELLLLKTAALFHDVGFTMGYQDHELLGIKMAKEILPGYDYTEEQIQEIEDLIYATKLPPNPKNHLEEIMCDADLDYLGRVDFIPVSQMLFKELVDNGKIEDNLEKWNKLQIKFIENHQYFTETAKSLRDVNKKKQLESIRKLVNSE